MEKESNKLEKANTIIDIAIKILAVLVIPLILWGFRLEMKQAVLQERLISSFVQADSKIKNCLNQLKQRQDVINKIQRILENNSRQLSSLSSRIDGANKRLDDILKFFIQKTK